MTGRIEKATVNTAAECAATRAKMTSETILSAARIWTPRLGDGRNRAHLEEFFGLKAEGGTLMPPKIFFHRGGARFYSSMVSCAPELGYAGCKWQSGDPENLGRGLPYIQGLYILSEDATGRPIAIMDPRWITGNRTAAATAVAAKHLARRDSETLAILGCGLQGRKNVEALRAVLPGLNRCQAYDIVPEREQAFVAEMRERLGQSLGKGSAEAAVRGADIVVTAGPIEERRSP